ncbi:MAG: hypothetical protein N3D11_07110 [Candidatus Sumerlaeia bacterium]|nr:hypothetical protein [Candidatus Sumerlaeia bacterium]
MKNQTTCRPSSIGKRSAQGKSVFVLAGLLVALALGGACGSKQGKDGTIAIYRAQFNSNAEMMDWQWNDSGQWAVRDGWLEGDARQTSQTRTILWLKQPIPDNLVLEFEGECLDHPGELNCYFFGNGKTLSGYELIVGGSDNKRITLNKITRDGDEASRERLGRESLVLHKERPYAVKVKYYRGAIKVYVNEDLLISTSDEKPDKDAEHRYFGFSTVGNWVRFDNLKIENKR